MTAAEVAMLAGSTPLPAGPHVAVVALLAPAALLARRRRPRLTLAVTMVSVTLSAAWWLGEPVGQACVAVALYHVGFASTRRRQLVLTWLPVTAALAVFTVVMAPEAVYPAGFVAFMVLASVVAGASLAWSAHAARLRRVAREADLRAAAAGRVERERLAGELHDVVTHAATASVVQARLAAAALEQEPEAARQALKAIERAGSRALRELRELRATLDAADRRDLDAPRPADPHDSARPVPADAHDLEALFRDGPARTTVHRAGTPAPLHPSTARQLYRIVQEALTNAGRHGTRPEATVTVDHGPAAVTVTVRNPVRGDAATPVPGRGLTGMRRRAALVRGTLHVSHDTVGFTVSVTVPWEA